MAVVVILEGCGGLTLESLPAAAGVDFGVGAGSGSSQQGDAAILGQVLNDGANVGEGEVAALGEGGEVAGPPLLDGAENQLLQSALVHCFQAVEDGLGEGAVTTGEGVDDLAAADSGFGVADDEEVALDEGQRVGQMDLRPGFLAGLKSAGVEEADSGASLADVGVEGDAGVVLHGARSVGQQLHLGVEHGGRLEPAGRGDGLAALGLVVGYAGDVDGEAAAGVGFRQLLAVALEAADASA